MICELCCHCDSMTGFAKMGRNYAADAAATAFEKLVVHGNDVERTFGAELSMSAANYGTGPDIESFNLLISTFQKQHHHPAPQQ
eukprot:SAG31_NODE_10614_length_1117_cov_1.657171_2_plen_84_part_00